MAISLCNFLADKTSIVIITQRIENTMDIVQGINSPNNSTNIIEGIPIAAVISLGFKDFISYTPPNLRFLLLKILIASSKSSVEKSGHKVFIITNSEYAHCHNKKLDIRYSPEGLIIKSGSG